MAHVVVLGAGVAGHTAALVLRRKLGRSHEVTVVTPNRLWNWIPSNIWVGVGVMAKEDVTFELAPIYAKQGIRYEQAKAVEIHPEGSSAIDGPFVVVERTDEARRGERETLRYDYLVNATALASTSPRPRVSAPKATASRSAPRTTRSRRATASRRPSSG